MNQKNQNREQAVLFQILQQLELFQQFQVFLANQEKIKAQQELMDEIARQIYELINKAAQIARHDYFDKKVQKPSLSDKTKSVENSLVPPKLLLTMTPQQLSELHRLLHRLLNAALPVVAQAVIQQLTTQNSTIQTAITQQGLSNTSFGQQVTQVFSRNIIANPVFSNISSLPTPKPGASQNKDDKTAAYQTFVTYSTNRVAEELHKAVLSILTYSKLNTTTLADEIRTALAESFEFNNTLKFYHNHHSPYRFDPRLFPQLRDVEKEINNSTSFSNFSR